MKKIVLLLISIATALFAQAQTPIGQFRAHIPLHAFHSVAADDDYVYAAADNGVLLVDKATLSQETPDLSTWTKVEGLSDIDITRIYYDATHRTLIIAYDNGNLDFIKEDKLYNLRDIRDKQLTGSKQLSRIRIYGEHTYLVYPFGVVTIDLEDLVIEDTWFSKREGVQYVAQDIAVSDDYYFISTETGIYRIDKNYAQPANFMEWEFDTTAGEHDFDQLIYFHGRVFANKNGLTDTLYTFEQGRWQSTGIGYQDIRAIHASDEELIVCSWDFVEIFDSTLTRTYAVNLYLTENSLPSAQEAITDQNHIWIADDYLGLLDANRTYYSIQSIVENGPYDVDAQALINLNGVTVVVPGAPYGSAYAPSYHYPSISWFENQRWYYNANDFYQYDSAHLTMDLTNVAINPTNEAEWYIASWGNGLFHCVNQQIVAHYNAANSPLDSTSAGKTFVSGLAFDDNGNLWMTNSQSETMLKMLEPDGTWHEYNVSSGVLTSTAQDVVADKVIVDSRGYKWINFPRGSEFNRYNLIAFYDGGTYDNTGDDLFTRIDMNYAAEATSSTVYCMAEDLDGELWIGTDKGIKVIYYPSKVFDGSAYPRNILLEQDGYTSVLFEYEEITAIAIDGANRKWIGTGKAGVFLMSEDGQEQLLHFTADDNPLFSDQITSICIDQQSGEVFFGTAKGITSYRGTATAGFDSYEESLVVFPNPVRHDYTGPVAVNGLKTNSLCKITDARGRLVWQGYSNGGELVWYCVDHFGKRPATGVYYIMASDEEGKEKVMAKFLFIH